MRHPLSRLMCPRLIVVSLLLAGCHTMAEPGALCGTVSPFAVDSKAPSAQQIDRAIGAVYPALVRIVVVTTRPMDGRLQRLRSGGSGVIISPDGYVVTNHHVAGRASWVACDMPDGERIKARLIGTDPLSDIAVLKLDLQSRAHPAKPLLCARFGDSDELQVGDVVFAMGSPAALSQSVCKGIVSNTRMTIPDAFWPATFTMDGEEVGSLVCWIGSDAPIIGGNSGGPLVNVKGEVVGINELGIGAMGGAIPSNIAREVARQITETGVVMRSWTGIDAQPRLKDSPVRRGVLVAGVIQGSPAQKAGISSGDVVTHFDGVGVDCSIPEELPAFNRLMLSMPVGETFEIRVSRNGEPMAFALTTEMREAARGKDYELRPWGMSARDFTRISALEANRPDCAGVLVTTLRVGGPCSRARPAIEVGDVIVEVDGRPIGGVAELCRLTEVAMEGTRAPLAMVVAFARKSQRLLTVVKVGLEAEGDGLAVIHKPWLGMTTQVLGDDLAKTIGLPNCNGLRITQVYADTPTDAAGLRVGDIILKVNGNGVVASGTEGDDGLAQMTRHSRIGYPVDLDVIRPRMINGRLAVSPDEISHYTLKLEAAPTPAAELRRFKSDGLEFTARDMSFEERAVASPGNLCGAVIEKTEYGGWAQLAHLLPGDVLLAVNGHRVPDIATLESALGEVSQCGSNRVVFFIQRGIRTMYLETEAHQDGLVE